MPGRKSALWLAAAISVLTFVTVQAANGSTRERPCNGSVELCARTLDQVVLPGTHNSMSNEEYGWNIPNQHYSIPTQLEMGVRALLIDTHYGKLKPDGKTVTRVSRAEGHANGDTMYLCHTLCELGASELIPELAKVADFLESHPREVLTFVVQDGIDPDDHAKAVTESGLIDYIYTGPTDSYPTLGQMIATNQRVMMLSEGSTGSVPWFHNGYAGPMQETPYNFLRNETNDPLTPGEGMELLTAPANLDSSCRPNRGGTTASLFLMNHWVNGEIDSTVKGPDLNVRPDPRVAQVLNQPDVLVARAQACQQRRGKLPNIIAVDDFGDGDLISAVRELNGVAAKPFFEVTRPKNAAVKSGKKATYKLTATNWGDAESALTKVCATVPGRLAIKPKCRTFYVPQGNPGTASVSLSVSTRRLFQGKFKGKKTGPVSFTVSGAGDSVKTSAQLKVSLLKKKPKRKGR